MEGSLTNLLKPYFNFFSCKEAQSQSLKKKLKQAHKRESMFCASKEESLFSEKVLPGLACSLKKPYSFQTGIVLADFGQHSDSLDKVQLGGVINGSL